MSAQQRPAPEWGVGFHGIDGYITPWPAGKEHADSVVRSNPGAVLVRMSDLDDQS